MILKIRKRFVSVVNITYVILYNNLLTINSNDTKLLIVLCDNF